jgi:bacterioferritin
VKKNLLIAKLNWFYSLELNQVDLYTAQSKAFKGSYESIIFERTAEIEQGHVENIGKIMIERKAMKDYTDLINNIQNEYGEELETILKHNLADEDVHTAWFSERLCDYDHINLRE